MECKMDLTYLKDKDFTEYPKLRHDLWYSYQEQSNIFHLIVPGAMYEIPRLEAAKFLKIRPYCTGHNNIQEISKRSHISVSAIKGMIRSLQEIGVLHHPVIDEHKIEPSLIYNRLEEACLAWREQLKQTYIANDIMQLRSTKRVVMGWMLETYHYIKQFPFALSAGIDHTKNPTFKKFLMKYAAQEKGHERYIENCLIKMGFTSNEVRAGNCLVSTGLIHKQMLEMVRYEPLAVLPISLMIESLEYEEEELSRTYEEIALFYGFERTTFQDFLHHMKVDFQLGHGKIFSECKELLKEISVEKINSIVNSLHDLKHCFDLQSLEIKKHYEKKGTYMPRQYISFFGI